MISKYFSLASVLVATLFLLSSCLNSSSDKVEYSPDAQIHSFSLSSKSDTALLLNTTRFFIDQVNGKIFNKEPLPYQFSVDSVLISIRGGSTYYPLEQVVLTLDPNVSYLWRANDSVPIKRLKKITATAPDGINKKEYLFEFNVYQKDPYLLNWQQVSSDYLPEVPLSQRSIILNNNLITYYRTSRNTIEAVAAKSEKQISWTPLKPIGLLDSGVLSSITVTDWGIFALDSTNNSVYFSNEGETWNAVSGTHKVRAIYGTIPDIEGGKLLLAVEEGGVLHFAETIDFTKVSILNPLPDLFPISSFSAAAVDAPVSYSIKQLLLAGGITANNTASNKIWILQKRDNRISWILSRIPTSISLRGSNLFYYDNKPYLMISTAEKNLLYLSGNYGLDWELAGTGQSFPTEFLVRKEASVCTDKDNNIWIFGGISPKQTQVMDVWRATLNKFTEM